MKRLTLIIVIGLLLLLNMQLFGQQQKLAQAGMKFLQISLDARASALANSVTSIENNSTAMFYNPASMARIPRTLDVSAGQVNWIADIDYVYGSIAVKPARGHYGTIGVSVVGVSYGIFRGTHIADNDLGYVDTGNFSPDAFLLGLGYAKALTDKFSIGGNAKYVHQNLGSVAETLYDRGAIGSKKYSKSVYAFDFGILYHTGYKSLNFGMCVRNFSEEVEYIEEGFQLPLTFRVGVSMNVLDIWNVSPATHAFQFSVDAVHNRDYDEQVALGGEYLWNKILALRAGYIFPTDEEGLSLGIGLLTEMNESILAVDYSYTSFGIFDDVQRLTLRLAL